MNIVYHHLLCPFSRQVRVALKEKKIIFKMVEETYWQNAHYHVVNPVSSMPIFTTPSYTISDAVAICEFLEEEYPETNLLGENAYSRAEIRKVMECFNNRFFNEVSKFILNERIIRFFSKEGAPNASVIRSAKELSVDFLEYIGYLVRKNHYIARDKISMADIVAAAHLSVLDYFGDVPWQHNREAKEWYAIIKSRPSFRPLLADRIPGFNPASHYEILDF